MHILVSAATASDLAETAEQSIDYLQKVIDYVISKAHIFVSAMIILIIGWYLTRFACKIVRHSLDKTRLDASVTSFINSLTKFGLRTLLAIIVINKLGVDTTSLIALLTSASLAIGLAVQGRLANFAGGVLLLIMKPFVVGDYIDDGNGHEGTVISIEIIYTRLLTANNEMVCIPNGKLADSPVTNLTNQESRRIDFPVSISYDENIDRVRTVLLNVASECQTLSKTHESLVFVQDFDSSSVRVVLRVWAITDKYWETRFEIREAIKKAFDAEGIEIPYDHMDVNLINPEK